MKRIVNFVVRAGALAMLMLVDAMFGFRPLVRREDSIRLKCEWISTLTDEFGNKKREERRLNMIVLTGFDAALLSLFETNALNRPAAFGYMAIGGDGTAAAEGQTGLLAEYTSAPVYGLYQRQALTKLFTSGTKTIELTGVFGPNIGNGTVREAGLFNALTTGTMFNRVLIGDFNKTNTDTLTVKVVVNVA